MGNSSSICSDRNAIRNYDGGSGTPPIYPSAITSFSSTNGQTTPQIYKTTIPVNEQPANNSCLNCSTSSINPTADPTNNNNNKNNENIVITAQQHGNNGSNIQNNDGIPSHSNQQSSLRNENHTIATTTTTIEYELENGVAKLSKISTSRIAAEQASPLKVENFDENNKNLNNTEELLNQNQNQNQNHYSKLIVRNNLPPFLTSLELKDLQKDLHNFNITNNKNITTTPAKYSIFKQHHRSAHCSANMNNLNIDCKDYYDWQNCLRTANRDRLGNGPVGDSDTPSRISGLDRLLRKKYSKGLAFTKEERQQLGIHGLLPASVRTQDEQVKHVLSLLDRLDNDLDKYIYLSGLSERNEHLFYRVLSTNVAKMMPLVYTPTVGLACEKFSLIYQFYKGLFITIEDKGHIYEVLRNWPETDIRAICVTDGERILGLGDLGANGMGIPVGKLSLYTALAGIKPSQCLPITLDVGTNTESLLQDPLYIGLRHKRIRGDVYDQFIDEFMAAVVRRFGQNCLIQFEDFANANAFRLLAKYRNSFCTFNDDIQGTAAVAVGGLLASLKIKNTALKDNKILFFGAGEAALGIAGLCSMALQKEGLSVNEAKTHIWMVDSKGLIVKDRPSGGLTEHKLEFAQDHEPIDNLLEAIRVVQPTVLIGAAAVGGAFTTEILELMAKINETPIIFALSNPTSKAECTAEQAYTFTDGRAIFSSGSPFAPVEYKNKTFYPGQGNNSYIFPGVALGVICAGMTTIPEEVFLISAKKLAALCSAEDLEKGSLYPPLKKINCISLEIAAEIMEYAYRNNFATVLPEPKDKREFIRNQTYDVNYSSALPQVW